MPIALVAEQLGILTPFSAACQGLRLNLICANSAATTIMIALGYSLLAAAPPRTRPAILQHGHAVAWLNLPFDELK